MEDNKISNKDLLNIIKHGHAWPADKIRDAILELLRSSSAPYSHELDFDRDDKYHFIYDEECYLFIFDGKIELRCDRDIGTNANKTFVHKISEEKDITAAYKAFKALIAEAEED
jgi:hypothetical protein